MSNIQVSIFGSWARPHDWSKTIENIRLAAQHTSYEIVVAGPNKPAFELPKNMTFIHVDPDRGAAHCAQIAERQCVGETIMLLGDDCRFAPNSLDNAYTKYRMVNDYKCMIHFRWGTGPENDITDAHPYLFETPDPKIRYGFVLMSKKFFDEVGGYDKRFTFGPHDAEMQLRAYSKGGYYVYEYHSFLSEDLTAQGNTFGGTFYTRGGYNELQTLIYDRWYTNDPKYGGALLNEPRTPFEPIGE